MMLRWVAAILIFYNSPEKKKPEKCAMMQFLNIMKCQNSIYILSLMSVCCVNIFTEPLAHPKPTIFSRLHKYKVNIPARPVSKAVMKMNASLFPHRCILWSGSQAGHFLCDNPCQLGNWWPHLLMKDLPAPVTERESQNTTLTWHHSGVWDQALDTLWWRQRYPWDLVTILTRAHHVIMSSVLSLVTDPHTGLLLASSRVRSICEVCPVWSPSCELCELLSFPRYNRARDQLY